MGGGYKEGGGELLHLNPGTCHLIGSGDPQALRLGIKVGILGCWGEKPR